MIRGVGRWIAVGIFLAVMAGAASRLARASRAQRSVVVAETLRDQLVELRNEVDACLSIRNRSETRFQGLASETRELRQQVDSLETLDPRGVPAEVYEGYMERVDAYNESVTEWEREADDLSALAVRCDSLVALHNDRAESLQEFLVAEGIWEAEWLEDGGEASGIE